MTKGPDPLAHEPYVPKDDVEARAIAKYLAREDIVEKGEKIHRRLNPKRGTSAKSPAPIPIPMIPPGQAHLPATPERRPMRMDISILEAVRDHGPIRMKPLMFRVRGVPDTVARQVRVLSRDGLIGYRGEGYVIHELGLERIRKAYAE